MSRTALILAAHGSGVDAEANARLSEFADRIARRQLFDEVTTAFHRGEPTFATVLDGLEADEVTVVPVMTSDGYYSDVVLPRELAKNRRYGQVRLCQTNPLGTHPGIVSLVAQRIRFLMREHNLAAQDVCVALVGHGTPRHPRSRLATIRLAEALQGMEPDAEVLYAFLDEAPGVETILNRTTQATNIVIPFLISGGPHATVDIPARLGVSTVIRPDRGSYEPTEEGGSGRVHALERWGKRLDITPPLHGRIGDRFVDCDVAVGTHPEIIDVIIDLAMSDSPIRARSASDGFRSARPAEVLP